MEESEDNMSSEDVKKSDLGVKKPKKRSIIERELETNLTARVTSPVTHTDGTNVSRYGRARKIKSAEELDKKPAIATKSPGSENTPVKSQSPAYKMHAINSPYKPETPKRALEANIDNQIDKIYQENLSLSRFHSESSPSSKKSKVYIRKDLIQTKEVEDNIVLIKNLFTSPKTNTKRSTEKRKSIEKSKPQNGYIDNNSVVKMLDFDSKKIKKEKEIKLSKNELFEIEAKCPFQVGDLAWARMGTFPFWPCLVTRDPHTGMFVKKKLFGRVEHDIIHVTFFGDNGRRSWVMDNMLREYLGQVEFETAREQFTPEDKKKDPRLYAAYFISEKKQALWNSSVEEAEMLMKEPKRLRIDILNDIILKSRTNKKQLRSSKISRTDSDVSLSESLYDSLFSEDDTKTDDTRLKNRTRNKSLDVSEVVTACLDNMAAKTGMTKIQRQSHMDRWLQKAKSKTPEKIAKPVIVKRERKVSRSKKKSSRKEVGNPLRKYHSNDENESNSMRPESPTYTQPDEDIKPVIEGAIDPEQSNIDFTDINIKTELLESDKENNKELDQTGQVIDDMNLDSLEANNVGISDDITDQPLNKTRDQALNETSDEPMNEISDLIETSDKSIVESNEKDIRESSEKSIHEITEHPLPESSKELLMNKSNEVDEFSNQLITETSEQLLPPTKNLIIARDVEEKSVDNENVEVPSNLDLKCNVSDIEKSNEFDKLDIVLGDNKKKLYELPKSDKIALKPLNNGDSDESINFKTEKALINVSEAELKSRKMITKSNNLSEITHDELKMDVDECPDIDSKNDSKSIFETEDNYKVDLDKEVSNNKHCSCDSDKNVIPRDDQNLDLKNRYSKLDLPVSEKDLLSVDTKNELISNIDKDQNNIVNIDKVNNDSIDNSVTVTSEDILNVSGESESILPVSGDIEDENNRENLPVKNFEQLEPMLDETEQTNFTDSAYNSESVPVKSIDNLKVDNSNIQEKSNMDVFFRQVIEDTNTGQITEQAEKEQTNDVYDTEESSDDEPSPEYEPLGEEITEEFRKHMQTIESSITDEKDDELIAKICAKIEHEIKKSSPKKDDVAPIYTEDNLKGNRRDVLLAKNQEIAEEDSPQKITRRTRSSIKKLNEHFDNEPRIDNKIKTKPMQNGYINDSAQKNNSLIQKSKSEPQVVIVPLEQTITEPNNLSKKTSIESDKEKEIPKNEAIAKDKNSPRTERKLKLTLSLRRNKTKSNDPHVIENDRQKQNKYENEKWSIIKNDDIVLEEMKAKEPIIIPIENEFTEKNIPEIKQNGYHKDIRNHTGTPELDDDDFDVDAVSLNSEDSVISLSNANKCQPRRSLRSKPKRENGLENPEFLRYLELRQDYLIDEHPELSQDEIVTYLYKTWEYEESLKSDVKKTDDINQSNLVKGLKQDTPPNNKKLKKSTPKNQIENYFRQNYNKKKIDFDTENNANSIKDTSVEINDESIATTDKSESESVIKDESIEATAKSEREGLENNNVSSTTPIVETIDSTELLTPEVNKPSEQLKEEKECNIVTEVSTPKRSLRSKTKSPKTLKDKELLREVLSEVKEELNGLDTESMNSEDSEVPLRKLRFKAFKENPQNKPNELNKEEDTVSIISINSDDEPLLNKLKKRKDKRLDNGINNPEFRKFLELRQDAIMDENPQLTEEEIVDYLYKIWLYEETNKSELKKNDEIEQSNLVKGLNQDPLPKKVKRKPRTDKIEKLTDEIPIKEKPKRKTIQPCYNEDLSDLEEELEVFEIFKKHKNISGVSKAETDNMLKSENEVIEIGDDDGKSNDQDVKPEFEQTEPEIPQDNVVEMIDVTELYFEELTKPKPNVFKGLLKEKVCEICEKTSNLYKCKTCNGMFHIDCVKKERDSIDGHTPSKGRKKKKKLGRKHRSLEGSEWNSDEKLQDVSEELPNTSIDLEPITFDAETIEAQLTAKMQEIMSSTDAQYDSNSSDDGIDWSETVAGKCEIVDVKLKVKQPPIDYTDFRCNNCQKYDTPICFVCKSAVTKNGTSARQKCHAAHCFKYYHLECLDHWPQTQFCSGETSRSNKKVNEYFETLTCPRHVCHTCVSDDPRGCKTRFSGDKLARCVRCPATYHSFTKCLPAGSQILSASQIICPRHYQLRPGKVPCHVNTGWCFICAQGGSLICCEYCPTSFHAECLNIKPPEGNYMCEDCETGRLPLYGEMVWVKLGHYRWWPALILHPCEIPSNIMAVKHSLGEFVVRFFGQYDYYWVNRGRVFPFQEGDSGRISSQKSKIDAAFTMAMEHAQRAFEILKKAKPNEEESLDIASSLLPPHYVKLKTNKPCGSVCLRKAEDPALSLTQCDCDPNQPDPCGPYSHCLNRMLLTECGPTCKAGDRCNNRAFEKRQYPKLVPYRTPHRGWGLKTLEDIRAGQFVIEYVGELIDEEEFKRRMRRKHEIRDENFYFLTLDKERMIDAGPKGNFARFMNHCCEPNCETQKWTVLGDVRVGLFALEDIPANSEVTFNYNLECAGIDKKRCMCGAKRCSGYIGAKPKQDESQSKKAKDGKLQKRSYKKRKNVIENSPSSSKIKSKRLGRPPKPKELTEIEKDLLIIKSATNSVTSVSSEDERKEKVFEKSLKRKRGSLEESPSSNDAKKLKCDSEGD